MPRANYVIPPENGIVSILDNAAIERLLSIEDCMQAIGDGYREWAAGNAAIRQKKSVHVYNPEEDSRYTFVSFDGGVQKMGTYALRMRSDLVRGVGFRPGAAEEVVPEGQRKYCGLVMVFSSKTGLPLAIMPDGYIQHARVAACAGIAAKYMARADSEVLGILGSQWMARLHAAALCAVRPIKRIGVYSPNPAHRAAFAREMSARLEIEVEAKDSPEEVVRGSHIVACCTDARAPVFRGASLDPGTFICNVLGSELDPETRARVDHVVMNQPVIWNEALGSVSPGERPVATAGRPPEGIEPPRFGGAWGPESMRADIPLLSDVIAGKAPGRMDDTQITFFNNNEGTGIQFVATAAVILAKLEQSPDLAGVHRLPLDWFVQDIPD